MMLRTWLAAAMVFAGKAFGHDTWSTYMFQGTGLSAEDEFNQRDDIDFNATLLPGRCTHASNSDLLGMHDDYYWRHYCETQIGCSHVDHWHANGVNMYGRETCIREAVDRIRWSSPSTQHAAVSEVSKEVVNDQSSSPLVSNVKLRKQTTEGLSGSLSSTISIGHSSTFTVGVPTTLQTAHEFSIGFDVTTTETQHNDHHQIHEVTATVTVPPGEARCLSMECDSVTSSATFSLDVCLSGSIRCDFGSHGQCHGHYYWLPSVSQCHTISGRVNSRQLANCRVSARDGRCNGVQGVQLADLVLGEESDEVSARALGQHVPVAACVAAASAVFLLTLGVRARLRRDAGRLEERLLV